MIGASESVDINNGAASLLYPPMSKESMAALSTDDARPQCSELLDPRIFGCGSCCGAPRQGGLWGSNQPAHQNGLGGGVWRM